MTSISERPRRTVLRGAGHFDATESGISPARLVLVEGTTISAADTGPPPSEAELTISPA